MKIDFSNAFKNRKTENGFDSRIQELSDVEQMFVVGGFNGDCGSGPKKTKTKTKKLN